MVVLLVEHYFSLQHSALQDPHGSPTKQDSILCCDVSIGGKIVPFDRTSTIFLHEVQLCRTIMVVFLNRTVLSSVIKTLQDPSPM